jgi:hypothetical protein
MNYYIVKQGKQEGPFAKEDLLKNGLTKNTLVWCNGMKDWTKAGEVPDLEELLSTPPTPPTSPTPPAPQIGGYNKQESPIVSPNPQQPKPDSHMLWAVLSTCCCCIPLGAYAIYCSIQVDECYKKGDYQGAIESAEKAKTWSIISAVAGFIVGILYTFATLAEYM